jgi:hypothetical protein
MFDTKFMFRGKIGGRARVKSLILMFIKHQKARVDPDLTWMVEIAVCREGTHLTLSA